MLGWASSPGDGRGEYVLALLRPKPHTGPPSLPPCSVGQSRSRAGEEHPTNSGKHGKAIWHRAWIANDLELDLEGQKGEICQRSAFCSCQGEWYVERHVVYERHWMALNFWRKCQCVRWKRHKLSDDGDWNFYSKMLQNLHLTHFGDWLTLILCSDVQYCF